MFDLFKSSGKSDDDSDLTSLDLRTAPASPARPKAGSGPMPGAKPAAAAQPVAPAVAHQPCVQLAVTPETMLVLYKNIRQRSDEWIKNGPKPKLVFYLVYPQQGHTLTVSTPDGSKTILPIFSSVLMAKAYLAGKGLQAVIAACLVDAFAEQTDKWITAGMNCYALNPCFRCGTLSFFPITDLQIEGQFFQTWGLETIARRIFTEVTVRNAQNQIATNPKAARDLLERVRDHLDCDVPYLHWVIAILAGLTGDMQANAAAIQRLEQFGPDFAGKLQGVSFDPAVPGSQMSTMPGAIMGLLASYGLIAMPTKPAAG